MAYSIFKRTSLSLIALLGLSASVAHATDGLYSVPLNKNELVRLPAPASAVIIGDPSIADVSIHSSDTLLVIGRSYGVTNLIILDEAGRTIMNSDIQVTQNRSHGNVRVFKIGQGRESYSCTPECLPSPALGDMGDFIGNFSAGTTANISNPVAAAPFTPPAGLMGGPR